MTAIVLFGVLLGTLDLGRVGFVQHNLDNGAADLAGALATLSGTNSSGNPSHYVPTALDVSNSTTAAQIQADLTHASQVANGAFGASPLLASGAVTLTNGQVTVAGAPDLTAPIAITVSVTVPVTLIVGVFVKNKVWHLAASAAAITPTGQG